MTILGGLWSSWIVNNSYRAQKAVDRREAPADLDRLETEQSRPDLADLDLRSTRELVAQIAAEDALVPAATAAAGEAITAAVDAVVDRLGRGGRLIYVGAGTPGRLAGVDAAECVPTFGVAPGLVVALMAGGPAALVSAVEGIEDDPDAGAADLRGLSVGELDAVVGIAASGRTPYVLGAMAAARAAGAVTIGLSNNPGTILSAAVDFPIEVLTGPEVVAGSTRMKAGTAQKLVLNAISTAAMVRLGKTYGNLMVDVKATNGKLRQRAQRIVLEATGASPAEAAGALDASGWHAKTAIVMLLKGVSAAEARVLLEEHAGSVRAILGAAPVRP